MDTSTSIKTRISISIVKSTNVTVSMYSIGFVIRISTSINTSIAYIYIYTYIYGEFLNEGFLNGEFLNGF